MKFMKLPVIAASAALCLVACSEDTTAIANAVDELGGDFPASSETVPGGEYPGSSAVIPGGETFPGSSAVIPGGETIPGSSATIPGGETVPGSSATVPGSSAVVPGSSAAIPGSSSSTPWHQYSSNSTNPGGNGAGDDENDNEDSRTLDGTQILLKLSGTSATVENNNGCVEVADKKATLVLSYDTTESFMGFQGADFGVTELMSVTVGAAKKLGVSLTGRLLRDRRIERLPGGGEHPGCRERGQHRHLPLQRDHQEFQLPHFGG